MQDSLRCPAFATHDEETNTTQTTRAPPRNREKSEKAYTKEARVRVRRLFTNVTYISLGKRLLAIMQHLLLPISINATEPVAEQPANELLLE